MRIAVTFLAGQVFGHFGKTKEFAIFDIENNKVVDNHILPVVGEGHGALAGLLHENRVDVVICGGIGEGARNALAEYGIKFVAGAQGNVRHAVEEYLAGTLENNPVKYCGHHHEEGHTCGENHAGCGGCHH